jgi:5-methylcytosine-specific restriction protein B
MTQPQKDENNKINADDIRNYCIENYIIPARNRGEKQTKILVSDVHRKLGLKNRHAQVGCAIGANIFEDVAKVKQISRDGPPNGSKVWYTFQFL